jgi:four helix bundle protein
MLDYERLDAYQCALRFVELSLRIQKAIPPAYSDLSDQLRRATMSIPPNIAEGAGKTASKDRARYYATARGSAMECGAIVDLARLHELVKFEVADEAKRMLERLVAMLSKMCR